MMSSKTCPKCGRAYPDEAQICEDCDEALVAVEESTPVQAGELVHLTTVADIAEAMILTNVLVAEGIRALTEDLTLLSIAMGRTGTMAGGVRVLINSEDAEAALAILESHRRGELALSDEDDEPGPEIT